MLVALALVLLDHLDPFHNHPLLAAQNGDHFAALAALGPGYDHYFVALFHVESPHNPQITSGASEIIFMNFLSRSSRATGPKMRVPRGLFSLSIITMAFVSNRRYEPSLRRIGWRVRTTTASTTSPFFTAPSGAASLMWALIMSPTCA